MAAIRKSQIYRRGDRLKKGSPSEGNLRLVDESRRSFSAAYDSVILSIREKLKLKPTARPVEANSLIAEKL